MPTLAGRVSGWRDHSGLLRSDRLGSARALDRLPTHQASVGSSPVLLDGLHLPRRTPSRFAASQKILIASLSPLLFRSSGRAALAFIQSDHSPASPPNPAFLALQRPCCLFSIPSIFSAEHYWLDARSLFQFSLYPLQTSRRIFVSLIPSLPLQFSLYSLQSSNCIFPIAFQ